MQVELGQSYKQINTRAGELLVKAIRFKRIVAGVYVQLEHTNGVTYWSLVDTFFKTHKAI